MTYSYANGYTFKAGDDSSTAAEIAAENQASYLQSAYVSITPVDMFLTVPESTDYEVAIASGATNNDGVYALTSGTPVTFTIMPEEGYAVYSVSYTIGEDDAVEITADDEGVFTIPGDEITDSVALTVEVKACHTITFQSGTGSSMTTGTYYAWDDEAGLYTTYTALGLTGEVDADTVKNDLAADTSDEENGTVYRLAADSEDEPLWAAGESNMTTDGILENAFAADTTYTANAIQQFKVTFAAGGMGFSAYAENAITEVWVDSGKSISNMETVVPEVTAADNYAFAYWSIGDAQYSSDELAALAIEQVTEVTPVFKSSLTITIPEDEDYEIAIVSGATEDDGVYTITSDTPVEFTVTPAEGCAVYSVSYTVGENAAVELAADEEGTFTIPGDALTGDVALTVFVKEYHEITFQSGTGSNMTTGAYYAWDNEAGLYTTYTALGLTGEVDVDAVKNDLVADTSDEENGMVYRLAADSEDEPLWIADETSMTTEAILENAFTVDTTYTANTVQQFKVTFAAGSTGFSAYAEDAITEVWVDSGKTMSDMESVVPSVTAKSNYELSYWSVGETQYSSDELAALAISQATEATPVFAKTTSGGGSGGSGSSSSGSSSYRSVSVQSSDNGTVSSNVSTAKSGSTVTVNITPDEGYELDTLTITNVSTGETITATKVSDTEYTFTMPSAKVTVEATFVEAGSTGSGSHENCSSEHFIDVALDAWYHEFVDYVVDSGLMTGTSDITFEPDTDTTRGMIATILYRMEEEPTAVTANSFNDVASGSYYEQAIAWAEENGIVEGYGDGTFRPDTPITREQMVAILYRYAIYKGYDMTTTADLSGYTDAGEVSEYAETAMQWAVSAGTVEGTSNTTIAPQSNATRAQVAAILMRFAEDLVSAEQ